MEYRWFGNELIEIDSLGFFGILWDSLRFFGIFMEFSGFQWINFGIFKFLIKIWRIDDLAINELKQILWDSLGFFEIFREFYEIFWAIFFCYSLGFQWIDFVILKFLVKLWRIDELKWLDANWMIELMNGAYWQKSDDMCRKCTRGNTSWRWKKREKSGNASAWIISMDNWNGSLRAHSCLTCLTC